MKGENLHTDRIGRTELIALLKESREALHAILARIEKDPHDDSGTVGECIDDIEYIAKRTLGIPTEEPE